MNNKCIGCGAILQHDDRNLDGYIDEENIEFKICRRCFRLKNYGEYSLFNKDNLYYKKIISDISNTNDLIIHVVDVFNLYNDSIFDNIKNKSILVITKKDVLPKSVKDNKLLDKIKKMFPNYKDYIIVSSKKNYNLDLLLSKIMKYKKSNNVYFIGYTNSGKSTLINRILKNYSDNKDIITTSYYPSTTLDKIEVKVNDNLTIIDTPGILQEGNIIHYIDLNLMKKVVLDSEIKPKIFQTNNKCSILIDEFCRLDYTNEKENNIIVYCSNKLDVYRRNINNDELNNLKKIEIEVSSNEDLVINGLCFIKVKYNCKLIIYTLDGISIYKRNKLI